MTGSASSRSPSPDAGPDKALITRPVDEEKLVGGSWDNAKNSGTSSWRAVNCLIWLPVIVAKKSSHLMRHSVIVKILLILGSGYLITIAALYMFSVDVTPSMDSFKSFFSSLSSSYSSAPPAANVTGFDVTAPVKELHNHADGSSVPFDWNEWIDLRITDGFGEANNSLKFSFIKSPKTKLDDYHYPNREHASEKEFTFAGKLFLSRVAPVPSKVILVGDARATYYAYSDDEERNHLDFAEERHNQKRDENGHPVPEIISAPPLSKDLVSDNMVDRTAIDIDESLFHFDVEALQVVHENSTAFEKKRANMIKDAAAKASKSGKHFFEASVTNDPALHGMHYDWRFFNFLRHGVEHEAILHHLIRTWAKFAEQEGLMTWMAHGSLIGWYWNGLSLPWDSDTDIQMPIMELDRFANLYNGTLVVEDEEEGTGRYYIDVSPWYVEREKGNGANVIDARFIDIRSGIYIDITGLAETVREKQFNCKNYHFYRHDWLSPMRRTLFEGSALYIPNNYEKVLKEEYNKYQAMTYGNWMFGRDLELWVPKKKCSGYNVPNKKWTGDNELTMYGACGDKAIFNEYQKTVSVTNAHSEELDIYNNLDLETTENGDAIFIDTPEALESLTNIVVQYHPPLRSDPMEFSDKRKNDWN